MAESNQRTARAQKALKAQKAQSGAAKAKARQEEEALLRADTFTNAPKVSRRTLTKEEREALAKQREAETKEAEKIASAWSKGGLGRWWARLQSSPDKVTWGMAIVALGVVYGDIGTSPLYTAQTFLAGQGGLGGVDREAVLGMLSLVFWSITLITTVKYVLIAMRIDNNGEGGIFALYSLIRKYGAWLAIPAMLGGAAFLADSVLTPAVSISSAVEGLQTLLVIDGERSWQHTAAILRVLHALGWPWRLAWVGWLVPAPLRDALYRWVARNRYRIWGRSATCMLPAPEHRARFLEQDANL